jgi:DNA-binding transcriptional LysR family regulator
MRPRDAMELTPLRYFSAIARAGHMTRAARHLGISQPALSAVVRKLEREVGAELLHRTGRGVELTEAGRAFLAAAEEAVRRVEAGVISVRQIAGLEAGSIRIGGGATATTYLLPAVVSEVRLRHPGLRFYVREAGSTAIAAAVLSGELDLGIVTLPLPAAAAGGAKDLLTVPLVDDEMRLIVPEGHALAGRKSFRWADLSGSAVVAFEAGTAVRGLIDRASGAAGVPLAVVMELRSIESIKHMVAAGIGVGFVSRFALSAGEGLTCRDGRLTRRMAIVRRADRVPSPAAAQFERELLAQTRRAR